MKKLGLIVMFLYASVAQAQELKIADGSSSGIYKTMLQQMRQVCGDSVIKVTEIDTSGAVENLERVIGNEANAAFMHSDVITWRSKSENLDNLRTLLALFPEDVHFVAKAAPFQVRAEEKSWGGLKTTAAQTRTLNSISDLSGLSVGAAGGGYITAQVIRLQGEVNYNAVQFSSGKEVLDALASGRIAAAVFVGAHPLPNLKSLGKDYKILSIGDSVKDKLKSVYRSATVTYTNLASGPVATVAADALLVARVYRTPKFVQALTAFKQCFIDNLDELKETPGTHKAWQKVQADTVAKWPMYELAMTAPVTTAPVTLTPRKKKAVQ